MLTRGARLANEVEREFVVFRDQPPIPQGPNPLSERSASSARITDVGTGVARRFPAV
jgi:hypothetical protein